MAKLSNFYKVVSTTPTTVLADNQHVGDQGAYSNYSWYQRIVQGSATRMMKYREYDMMDNDIEIARSLDTIAEEMTGSDPNDDNPIELVVDSTKSNNISPTTISTIKAALSYWSDLHQWNKRLFGICRITIKYGDSFFKRKNQTSAWEYINPKAIAGAVVSDQDITKIIAWQIRAESKAPGMPYNAGGSNFSDQEVETVSADNMVWFSMNDDMSDSAPFGESILKSIHRSHKQKELLEDAIIIYRIQRAPERRVFYVDVGKMPPPRVKAYIEGIKNEIRQRKVPTTGGGTDQVDSVYNPTQMSEDFFIPKRPDGSGTKIETLPGGQGLGQLDDLQYFQNKVFRGLRIPASYMMEASEGGASISDGKTGVAYIQELRFAMYVKRLQQAINGVLDKEFKRYLKVAGLSVDHSLFTVKLKSPENFGVYRQQQLNSDLLSTYTQSTGIEHLSKRFTQSKYLQLTDEEILLNFKQKLEELGLNPNGDQKANMIAVYGASAMDGMGGGPGMMAGTLGGMGFDQSSLGADLPQPDQADLANDQSMTPPDIPPPTSAIT